jgi:hypothetical protein
MAMFVDPRTKNRLPGIYKERRQDARSMFKNALIASVDRNSFKPAHVSESKSRSGSTMTLIFDDDSSDEDSSVDEDDIDRVITGQVESELARYNSDPGSKDFNTCPLEWWEPRASSYPIIAKFARKYLAIPASSASVERLFSVAGNIITEDRNRLKPENASSVIFLRATWRKLLDYLKVLEKHKNK